MRKIILAGAALLSLGAALPAYAQTVRTDLAPAAGATTGATLGFLFGGPIGAVIGGFSGAAVGTAVDQADVTYVGTHPVEQVHINGDIGVGYKVGTRIHLHDIKGDPDHAYFYANNRVWIVDRASGAFVGTPGFMMLHWTDRRCILRPSPRRRRDECESSRESLSHDIPSGAGPSPTPADWAACQRRRLSLKSCSRLS